ncbi:MAG: hypothetical protein H7249_04685 [Chitinophagaceae bacterium]|nr:hypothetical protein [Oligoflexus sp.]
MKQPVIIAEFAGIQVPTHSHVELYNSKELMVKAAQALGVCWGTAAITIFIPVIHLVVTPLALICGPFAAVFVYIKARKLPRLVDGSVTCNHCKAETKFHFVNASPPFYEQCQACRTGYEVLWPKLGEV